MKVLLIFACLSFAIPATAQESPAVTTVYLDYTGSCGGSLIETRRRERIARDADKIINQLRKEGRPVRIVVSDDSVILAHLSLTGSDGGWRRQLGVYNRRFSCGY